MSKDPVMMLYTADFLVGVSFMTMEARGQYITLLCLQHQKGHMDKADMEMAVGKIDAKVMSHFVQDDDGLYYNERAEHELKKRQAYCETRRRNRSKTDICETHDEHMKNICKTYDEHMKNICGDYESHMSTHMENENENININNKSLKDKGGKDKDQRHKYGQYNNVLLSDEDMSKLKAEFPDYEQRIERLSEYIASKGAKYKDHLATIRAWARKDKPKLEQNKKTDDDYSAYEAWSRNYIAQKVGGNG